MLVDTEKNVDLRDVTTQEMYKTFWGTLTQYAWYFRQKTFSSNKMVKTISAALVNGNIETIREYLGREEFFLLLPHEQHVWLMKEEPVDYNARKGITIYHWGKSIGVILASEMALFDKKSDQQS